MHQWKGRFQEAALQQVKQLHSTAQHSTARRSATAHTSPSAAAALTLLLHVLLHRLLEELRL